MNAMQPPQSIEEIKAGLETTEKGGVRQSIRNCLTVFQRDPLLSGAIAYNILTDRKDIIKPIGLVRSDARDKHLAHLLQSHYPAAAEGLRRRAWRYNTAVQRARELERQGLVCIIAPDSTEGMSTLTKNRACLEKMYAKGKQDAEALVRWMQNAKQDESVGT